MSHDENHDSREETQSDENHDSHEGTQSDESFSDTSPGIIPTCASMPKSPLLAWLHYQPVQHPWQLRTLVLWAIVGDQRFLRELAATCRAFVHMARVWCDYCGMHVRSRFRRLRLVPALGLEQAVRANALCWRCASAQQHAGTPWYSVWAEAALARLPSPERREHRRLERQRAIPTDGS